MKGGRSRSAASSGSVRRRLPARRMEPRVERRQSTPSGSVIVGRRAPPGLSRPVDAA